MKMLKRLFWLSWWRHEDPGEDQRPASFPPPFVDAEEFARLICSRRVEDLRILARRLSAEAKARV